MEPVQMVSVIKDLSQIILFQPAACVILYKPFHYFRSKIFLLSIFTSGHPWFTQSSQVPGLTGFEKYLFHTFAYLLRSETIEHPVIIADGPNVCGNLLWLWLNIISTSVFVTWCWKQLSCSPLCNVQTTKKREFTQVNSVLLVINA